MKQEIKSKPLGIKIILDASEIFPNDPGNGTPAMVYTDRGSGTYWRAVGEGEIDDDNYGIVALTHRQLTWLQEQELLVDDFFTGFGVRKPRPFRVVG